MSKQEFINILRASLSGQVPAAVVSENVTYYEDYINSQIRMGRTEQEVLQSLGNPRLIAKSIIDASKAVGQGSKNYSRETDSGNRQDAGQKSSRRFKMPIWLVLLLVFLAIFLIIGIVMRLLFFFAPLIMVAFLIVFLVKLFRDWLN